MASRAMWSTTSVLTSARVVISPATTTRLVVTSVSQATRLVGSAARQWSRTASLIWSATLSGWPILTDSLVNRYRSEFTEGSSCGNGKKHRRDGGQEVVIIRQSPRHVQRHCHLFFR